jgi:hypothetical protein
VWNSNSDEIRRERAREDMDIAAYPHVVEVVAHQALSCRALSAALLQLTGSARYHDIGQFLDRRAACAIEQAVGLLAQYDAAEHMYNADDRDDGEDEPELEAWTGETGAVCVGRTQKGKACTRRGSYGHDGKPYCADHYPYPEGYWETRQEREERWRRQYDERQATRKAILAHYRQVREMETTISDLLRDVKGALAEFGIPEPKVVRRRVAVPEREHPRRVERVDGLNFDVIETWQKAVFDVERNGSGLYVTLWTEPQGQWMVRELSASTWMPRNDVTYETVELALRHAYWYTTFYQVRRNRELHWFSDQVHKLVTAGLRLDSAEPFRKLMGVDVEGSGWRVMKRLRGPRCDEFQTVYAGPSEAEARHELRTGEDVIQALLIDTGNRLVDYAGEFRPGF